MCAGTRTMINSEPSGNSYGFPVSQELFVSPDMKLLVVCAELGGDFFYKHKHESKEGLVCDSGSLGVAKIAEEDVVKVARG